MWWAIGIFALAACNNCYIQAFAGAFQLTLLFQGSTDFTEEVGVLFTQLYRARPGLICPNAPSRSPCPSTRSMPSTRRRRRA